MLRAVIAKAGTALGTVVAGAVAMKAPELIEDAVDTGREGLLFVKATLKRKREERESGAE